MSGGHFEYLNDRLCQDIFGWSISPDYGDRGFNQSKIARKINPIEDLVMSELIFDVFCILHSFDWYKSGDTGEDDYKVDVRRFKDKWLNQIPEQRVREIIDDELRTKRDELYQAFNIDGGDSECSTPLT